MTLIAPVAANTLAPELSERIGKAAEWMGFRPNDALTMARVPGLIEAASALIAAAYGSGKVSMELKRMLAYLSSRVAGCRYCEAHTAFGLSRNGVERDKLAAIWQYRDSVLFDAAERAALDFAGEATLDPDAVAGETLAELRAHFDDDQIAEIVAVLSLFAFLNRWNAVVGTTLEAEPLAFAESALAHTGFDPGRHLGEED